MKLPWMMYTEYGCPVESTVLGTTGPASVPVERLQAAQMASATRRSGFFIGRVRRRELSKSPLYLRLGSPLALNAPKESNDLPVHSGTGHHRKSWLSKRLQRSRNIGHTSPTLVRPRFRLPFSRNGSIT